MDGWMDGWIQYRCFRRFLSALYPRLFHSSFSTLSKTNQALTTQMSSTFAWLALIMSSSSATFYRLQFAHINTICLAQLRAQCECTLTSRGRKRKRTRRKWTRARRLLMTITRSCFRFNVYLLLSNDSTQYCCMFDDQSK